MRAPLPRVVVMLGVVSLLTDASSEMILPLLPSLLLGALGGSTLLLGFIDGLADAMSAVLKLAAGHLSDKAEKKKPFVVVGYGISTAVRPLIGLAMAPWHIIVVRTFDRVGKGIRSAPRDAILASAVDRADAARAFGFHRAMDHAGAVVGPLLATAVLAAGLDVRQAIQCAWIPGIAAFVVLLFLREPKPTPPPLPAVVDAATTTAPVVSGPLPPHLKRLLVVIGLFSLVGVADMFLLVRAAQLGLPEPLLPVVWVVLHFAKVVTASQGSRLSMAPARAVALAWIAVAVGLAVVAVPSLAALWVGVVVVGAAHGLREPFEKVLVRELAPARQLGRCFGAYHLTVGISALPAGLWIGWLWSHPAAGATSTLLAAAGGAVFAALCLLGVAARPSAPGPAEVAPATGGTPNKI